MGRGAMGDADTAMGGHDHRFPSTRHSLLAEAIAGSASAAPARNAIAEVYWKPVYKYIRLHWRASNEEAKDLTQDFFTSLLERDLLARFDASRASFRTYLRLAADAHVSNARKKQGRLKRGGGAVLVSFDPDSAGQELAFAVPDASPEEIFLREWQRHVFALAIADLTARATQSGKETALHIFLAYDLAEEHRPTYEQLAERHRIPATTVTNHLAWARRELKRAVLARVESVTATRRELRHEVRALFEEPRP